MGMLNIFQFYLSIIHQEMCKKFKFYLPKNKQTASQWEEKAMCGMC